MNKINIKVNKAQLVLLISKEQPTIYKDYEYLIYKKLDILMSLILMMGMFLPTLHGMF